ncbi:hypothetical protein [Fluoribacter gormanii]|uniref:Uncharacterized protein n=1 Tax=Fluoribacter gormanii TaxID=464 RepID=A0A377GKC4_9GAMM|nr:hypothetical protein [Fluoribacter gormanii]KTD00946.1 hypothetical protein Lgor_2863 [Fluoribacter gormanii]SIQ83054.1 hypothetical protein SAMN05421777_103175 [Fluoribacter gormanii]STO25064.1 Uncharacterised protein [Fluoribacter gormanii]
MSDLSTKFTDLKLKQLYGHIINHYKNCVGRNLNITDMYNEMFLAVQFSIESPLSTSSLYLLDREEKDKAYAAFNKIFYALPLFRELPSEQQRSFNPKKPRFNPEVKYVINEYNYYRCNDSTLINWLILSSVLDSHRHAHSHHDASCCFSSNHHRRSSSSNDDLSKLIAALLIIAIAAFAAVLAFIALAYMLDEFANSIERFWHGEGWLKGAFMFATSLAFGAGSTFLTLNFAAAPLIALAVAAGFNPVGVVILGAVLFSIIGAGIGCLAMSMIYDSINVSANKESMDPADPQRFQLTAAEEASLQKKGIDPIAVKCAMVALRAEMAKSLGSEKPLPSFFRRYFDENGSEVNELLTKLRHLRKGELKIVEVGDLCFDCRIPQPIYTNTQTFYSQQTPPPSYFDTFYGVQPSAPAQYD